GQQMRLLVWVGAYSRLFQGHLYGPLLSNHKLNDPSRGARWTDTPTASNCNSKGGRGMPAISDLVDAIVVAAPADCALLCEPTNCEMAITGRDFQSPRRRWPRSERTENPYNIVGPTSRARTCNRKVAVPCPQ